MTIYTLFMTLPLTLIAKPNFIFKPSKNSRKKSVIPIFTNVDLNDIFVGRQLALDEFSTDFSSDNYKKPTIKIINGLSGIGKTSLVQHYAKINKEKYHQFMFMIDCKSIGRG